jgi:hypothetical protein
MKHHYIQSARKQRGVSVLSALLALVIFGILMAAQMQSSLVKSALDDGRIEGNLIEAKKIAINQYALDNGDELRNGLPVVHNGVTVPVGVLDGESMSPSIQNLIDMAYLPAGTADTTSLGGGTYRARLQLVPAGCAPAQCQVVGITYVDRPLTRSGDIELSNIATTAAVTALGGDGLQSTNITPANLIAMAGDVVPNPVAGTPAGIVATKVGYGSGNFGRFLVVGDTRDPQFMNNVSAVGRVTSETGVAVRPIGVACNLGEILISGEILSRAANCARTVWMDGANRQIGAADAAGTTRMLVDGTNGTLTMNGAGGAAEAGFTTNGALSTVFADSLVINSTAAVGAACPIANAAVWGVFGTEPILLKCTAGVWVSAGGVVSTPGAVCPAEGYPARTVAGISLICRDGLYRTLADMVGRTGLHTLNLYAQGDVVPNPVCDASSFPSIIVLGVTNACVVGGGACANNTGAFIGTVAAGTRVVSISGSDGSVAGVDARLSVASVCSSTP